MANELLPDGMKVIKMSIDSEELGRSYLYFLSIVRGIFPLLPGEKLEFDSSYRPSVIMAHGTSEERRAEMQMRAERMHLAQSRAHESDETRRLRAENAELRTKAG